MKIIEWFLDMWIGPKAEPPQPPPVPPEPKPVKKPTTFIAIDCRVTVHMRDGTTITELDAATSFDRTRDDEGRVYVYSSARRNAHYFGDHWVSLRNVSVRAEDVAKITFEDMEERTWEG